MVAAGKGHWLIDRQFARHSLLGSRLWRDPDSEASLGTTSAGEIYE